MRARFTSFHEFWPYYVSQHLTSGCRRAHFLGTSLGIICMLALIVTWQWWFLPLGLATMYGPNLIGHVVFERNQPTLRYSFYSLAADFVMYGKMWAGEMDAEVTKIAYPH